MKGLSQQPFYSLEGSFGLENMLEQNQDWDPNLIA